MIKKGFEARLQEPSGDDEEPLFTQYKMRDTYQTAMVEQSWNNYIRFVKVYTAEGIL